MTIGILTVDIMIPMALSLKEKRRALKSLKERLKAAFNISVAETDHHEKWQRAKIVIVNVDIDKTHAQNQLDKAMDFIDRFDRVQILDNKIELIN